MSILVDTHVFLWAATRDSALSESVQQILNSTESIFFSAASAWEIAIKWSKGALDLPYQPNVFIPEALNHAGYRQLAVNVQAASSVSSLPFHHRDPFDRILIAQAIANKMRLLSIDVVFKKYEVDVFWPD